MHHFLSVCVSTFGLDNNSYLENYCSYEFMTLALAIGQVQKIWPQRPYSSEKLGKWLFIVRFEPGYFLT